MLQYITDNGSRISAEDQVKQVLSAGCGWIQLATDGLTDQRIRDIVDAIMPECIEKQAFLTFRNRVDLAKEINVGGVTVNPADTFPSHARAELGAAAIVGVEAGTADQIASLRGLDVDFVELRPYITPDNGVTAPLGIDGIRSLCQYMEQQGFELPRVACGGVRYDDIALLMEAGCNGVAISEWIAGAADIAEETARCMTLLKQYEERDRAMLNA